VGLRHPNQFRLFIEPEAKALQAEVLIQGLFFIAPVTSILLLCCLQCCNFCGDLDIIVIITVGHRTAGHYNVINPNE